jgi:hypothetical protein
MTVIVGSTIGNTIYMASDRGASDGDTIISLPRPKITIRDGWIYGTAGSIGTGQLLDIINLPVPEGNILYLIRKEIVSDLKEMIEELGNNDPEHSADFLIGAKGRLFEVTTQDWGVTEIKEGAVGSGSLFSFGSLYTTSLDTSISIQDRLKIAVNAAITYSPTCQGPVDILIL